MGQLGLDGSSAPALDTLHRGQQGLPKTAMSKFENMKSKDRFKVIAIAIFGIVRGIFYLSLISSMFRWGRGLDDKQNALLSICFFGISSIVTNNVFLLIGFIKKDPGLIFSWLIFEGMICGVGNI